jgi:transcriptional regulator with XRE-family HTH domain
VRNPKTPLGAWIVEQRKARDWKSEELARQLGVADSTVRSWESGRAISADNLARLERLLGVQAPVSEGGGDAATLLAAFRDALLEQTRALAEVRLELREARRTAEEERGVIAEILARLEARLELGTEPASNGAGDAGPALRHA